MPREKAVRERQTSPTVREIREISSLRQMINRSLQMITPVRAPYRETREEPEKTMMSNS